MLRELFSEYLYLCSILLKSSHSQDTLRLLNETLIFDELWQESIKTFTISLFLSDLIGPVTNKKELNHFQKQTLEDLRGVNIVNFDESNFFGSIVSMRDNQLFDTAKQSVFKSLMFAKNILKYLKSVTHFFGSAIQLYFPQTFESQKQKKTGLDRGDSINDHGHQTHNFNHMGFSIGPGTYMMNPG